MSEARKKTRKPQIPEDWPQPLPESQDAMDLFIDALLLEDEQGHRALPPASKRVLGQQLVAEIAARLPQRA